MDGDLVGTTLGGYRIEALIGSGGMARVYRARDEARRDDVALKVIRLDASADPAFARRFAREARAIAGLDHPHILALHRYGEERGYAYLAMPFITGGTLADRLERAPSPRTVLALLRPIAEALDHAHNRGVIHRDVKPSNILLARGEFPLLADFGIARLVGEARLTDQGVRLGTPYYTAPEQRRGEAGDGRADQYALGIILRDALAAPGAAGPRLDPALAAALDRALDADPARRYPRCATLLAAVEAALDTAVRRDTIPLPPTHRLRPDAAGAVRPVAPREVSPPSPGGVPWLPLLLVLALVGAAAFAARPPRTTGGAPSTPAATATPAETPLVATARRAIMGLPGTSSGVFASLTTGEAFADESGMIIPAGAFIDLAIAGAAYERIASGQWRATDRVTLTAGALTEGTGILKAQPVGTSYTLDELIAIMLTHSDNTAANILIDRLGGFAPVNDYAARQGLRDTALRRRLFDLDAQRNGIDNTTTTGDIAAFFGDLYKGRVVNPALSARLLAILVTRAQTDRAWLLNEIPASAAAAHVTMTLAGVRADGGYLVAGDHPYILVLFARDADEATIERALAQASAAIYRAAGGR